MIIENLIQKSKELHKLRDSKVIYEALNKLEPDVLIELVNDWQPDKIFKPVVLLRFLTCQKLINGEKVTQQTIDELKAAIEARDISAHYSPSPEYFQSIAAYKSSKLGMFHQWKDPFIILFPFFYSQAEKKEIRQLLQHLADDIITAKSIDKAKVHYNDFDGANNYGTDWVWGAVIPEQAASVQDAYQIIFRVDKDGLIGGLYKGHRLKNNGFIPIEKRYSGWDGFLADIDDFIPKWKELNSSINYTLQKDEKEFRDRVSKCSPNDLNVYFQTLDFIIDELSLPDEDNLVFSTGSRQLSFQIGKRYCLNLKNNVFSFIAPEDYSIAGVEKGGFTGGENAAYFKNASANIVQQHVSAIVEAVQFEIERDNSTDPKEYDNAAFRRAIFDKAYRSSFFNYSPATVLKEEKEDNYIQETKKAMPLNQILYGPPGTGKTYNTIELAAELITGKKDATHSENKKTFDLLKKEGQIEFITFHQNYSYEDFVVGIKPDLDHADLKFRKNEGIFYQICERAKTNFYQSRIPASSSSLKPFEEVYEALFKPLIEDGEEIEVEMKSGKVLKVIEINGNSMRLRYPSGSEAHTMHRATLKKTYEDREAFEGKKIITGGMYTYYKPILERLWTIGRQTNVVTPLRNYVLIIDEINRANISRVFGELITLLEEDKRLGAENELRLTLPNGEQDFALPPNLYILGTMNTADKSIALVDIALRRRFEFRGFYPTKSVIDELSAEGKLHDDVPGLLTALNKKIFDKKGADFLVGHAYFINKITDEELLTTLKRKVIPLLMEYFSGKIDLVRELFSNSGYEVSYDTDTYDWTIAKP